MRARSGAMLTWGLCAITIVLAAFALVSGLLAAAGGRMPGRFSTALYVATAFPVSVLGALITSRRRGNRVGLLLVIGALALSVSFAASYVDHGAVRWLASWTWVPALTTFMYTLLLFPDGRLPSRGWRAVAWAVAAWSVLAVAILAVRPWITTAPLPDSPVELQGTTRDLLRQLLPGPMVLLLVVLYGLFLASAASLIPRFMHARGQQRQQLKWLTYAGALTGTVWLLPTAAWLGEWRGVIDGLATLSVPIAIGIALLRHRLYDIDRIVNRTLVYGLLTALLALVYALGVFVLGQLMSPATGDSQLAVALSTLAVAALFQPARRRLQAAVDRRFSRARYDAMQTVDAFSRRLRYETDLDTLASDLLTAVHTTMQPTRARLWLRGLK